MTPTMRRSGWLAAMMIACAGCFTESDTKAMTETFEIIRTRPDRMPVMLNPRPPFEYPRALLAKKIQGNVLLRLHIDSTGKLVPDSTKIIESSGQPELDSAALRGVPKLRFQPASRKGVPLRTSFLFPVFFRAPGAPPLPGDTILKQYEQQQRSTSTRP